MKDSTFVNNSITSDANINGINNNIQSQVNTVNTINPNMSMNNQTINNTAKKKSNKGLIIVFIIVIVIAIASAVVAYILITNSDSKTENDYESNNGTNNTTTNTTSNTTSTESSNTIEQDGFIFNKKSGYEYDNNSGILYIYGSNSAFQVSIFPYSFDIVSSKSTEIEDLMASYGYTLSNKKTTSYDGKNVLSYEISYEGKNVLYVVYSAPDTNYSVQLLAVSNDNTFNYNLITESFNLINDIKQSGTTTYAKTEDNIPFSSIGDNLFSDINS